MTGFEKLSPKTGFLLDFKLTIQQTVANFSPTAGHRLTTDIQIKFVSQFHVGTVTATRDK